MDQKITFKQWFRSIEDRKMQNVIRWKILEANDWTYQIWYNKLHSITPVTRAERAQINHIGGLLFPETFPVIDFDFIEEEVAK